MIKTGLGINMRKFLSLNLLFFLFIFSISSSEARAKSWLGVEFRPLTKEFIELNNLNLDPNKKLIVTNVVRKSPAHLGGIIPGDVILSLNNYEITGIQNNLNLLSSIIKNEKFISGDINTGFIEEEYPNGFNSKIISKDEAFNFSLACICKILISSNLYGLSC